MGMAHRGRLNVLANFVKKSFRVIFTEFTENYVPNLVGGDADVKYHLGYRTIRKVNSGAEVEIRLAANPSHLEAVDPVVEGSARARQRIRRDTENRRKVLPLLVHGDAAFAGQGIVYETLNMSQLPGYSTGGTVHIVVNNQIGFTTLPEDARSSMYATDIGKMLEVPIFHVNGDDPLAVRFVTELALDFRQEFGRDAIIDMYCYRRYGHNEGDEPAFTQPDLYAKIDRRPSVAKLYRQELVDSGTLSEEEATALASEFEQTMQTALDEVKARAHEPADRKAPFNEATAIFQPEYSFGSPPTAITPETLKQIVDGLTRVPEDFNILPKIKRMLVGRRREVFEAGGPYDWGYAEALAFGSLLLEDTPVRLSGQDVRRGTFSHRHAVWYDAKTGKPHIPLLHLAEKQARICIYNSLLSEAAVLGFDYGYSLDYPEMLCLWERSSAISRMARRRSSTSSSSRRNEAPWLQPLWLRAAQQAFESGARNAVTPTVTCSVRTSLRNWRQDERERDVQRRHGRERRSSVERNERPEIGASRSVRQAAVERSSPQTGPRLDF